jgi:hypothetical protein
LPPALAGDLEDLRRSMLRRLDVLEALAMKCGTPASEAERLEQQSSRCQELAERLESDRKLLAAAWERLERERLEAAGARPAVAAQLHPSSPGDSAVAPDRPPARPAAFSPAANPVAATMLRQFQALCSDVRRTTDARFSTR